MIILQGGLCVDPASGLEEIRDIMICDGKIAAIETHIDPGSVDIPSDEQLEV